MDRPKTSELDDKFLLKIMDTKKTYYNSIMDHLHPKFKYSPKGTQNMSLMSNHIQKPLYVNKENIKSFDTVPESARREFSQSTGDNAAGKVYCERI